MYRAEKCLCGHSSCRSWHVEPVAAVQGVSFTQKQAEGVARFLNWMESGFSGERHRKRVLFAAVTSTREELDKELDRCAADVRDAYDSYALAEAEERCQIVVAVTDWLFPPQKESR